MRHESASSFVPAVGTVRVELALLDPEGERWTLTVSPGIERFIGYYPRLDGIDPGGPLLRYRRILAAA